MGKPPRILSAIVFIFNVSAALGCAESSGVPRTSGLSQQLVLARSLQQSGRFDSALVVLHEALSTMPDSALLLNQLGSVQQDLGQYLEAEGSYLRALSASAQPENAAEKIVVRTNLATLYLDTGQYSKGERLREQLEKAAAEVLDADPRTAAGLMNVVGGLEHVRGRDDEAERYYSQSLTLFRLVQGSVGFDGALVEANLGFLRLEARRYDAAAGLLRRAIREIGVRSDPGNPALIRPLICLASCENMRGNATDAESAARRAVELSLQAFGENHPVTATAMLQQATALRALHRKRQAQKLEKCANAWLETNNRNNLLRYTVESRALTSSAARLRPHHD